MEKLEEIKNVIHAELLNHVFETPVELTVALTEALMANDNVYDCAVVCKNDTDINVAVKLAAATDFVYIPVRIEAE